MDKGRGVENWPGNRRRVRQYASMGSVLSSWRYISRKACMTLEIEGTHNFVANDIVAHNTAIFQQASTTLLSVHSKAYFGGTATSTFDSTGALTLINALTYGGVTLSNAVTGTGNMVLSASPTFTGTIAGAAQTLSSTLSVTGLSTFGGFLSNASSTITSGLFSASGGASTTAFTNSGPTWLTGLTASSLLALDQNKQVVATTSIGVNLLTGILPIANGGTATSTQVTNGVNYFDGTRITSGTALTYASSILTSPLFAASQTSGTSTIAAGQGFTIGTSQFVLQQGSGNVGIGTTSPATNLAISGHCVTADTKLRRRRKARKGEEAEADEDGYIYDEVAIVDLEASDEVLSLDEKTGEMVWSRVRKVMFMGMRQTFRITTEDGRTIRTTAEHPYLVKNAKGKWLRHESALTARSYLAVPNAGWATVANLREGDEIAVYGEQVEAVAAYDTLRGGNRIGSGSARHPEGVKYSMVFVLGALVEHFAESLQQEIGIVLGKQKQYDAEHVALAHVHEIVVVRHDSPLFRKRSASVGIVGCPLGCEREVDFPLRKKRRKFLADILIKQKPDPC